MYNTKIQLASGGYFDYADIENNIIKISDIATAISKQVRFAGHLKTVYTVAQHCLLVSSLVPEKYALHGLLHDASETYVVDLPAPLKLMPGMDTYHQIEQKTHKLIFNTFGLEYPPMPEDVLYADRVALIAEFLNLRGELNMYVWKDWVTDKQITDAKAIHKSFFAPKTHDQLRVEYLARFEALYKDRV